MSALLGLLLAAPAPIVVPPWAVFSRSDARRGITESVSIEYSREVVPGRMEYRLTHMVASRNGSKSVSTTSTACPKARTVIGSMRDLEMPRFAPYGFPGDNRSSIRDGTYYSLRAPTSLTTGSATIDSTDDDAPLGKWINKAFDDLLICWKSPA